jgi:hypothetical protein
MSYQNTTGKSVQISILHQDDASTAAMQLGARQEMTDDEISGIIGGVAPGPVGVRVPPPHYSGPFREPIVW